MPIGKRTSPKDDKGSSISIDTPIPVTRLEIIRLLIALASRGRMEDSSLGCEKGFSTWTSLELINEFKKRMTPQFEMSDLGELTYYLGIEVSQEKDCGKIKQERYVIKILKEAGLEDCNTTLCPMEPGLKLSKAEVEHPISKGVGYIDSSQNVDIDDGRSTTGHIFYLGKSPITWCSQKQTTVVVSSCEDEFMAATAAACQAIWLRELWQK
ncbi:uncharacterized mitochondrial protein-like protein [Tanacetum coccineum]